MADGRGWVRTELWGTELLADRSNRYQDCYQAPGELRRWQWRIHVRPETPKTLSDEMWGVVQRLQQGVSKSRTINDAVGGDTVAWLIGALVGWSIDGSRSATLGLAGKATYEVARNRPSPGEQASRSHYVALSQAIATSIAIKARVKRRR